MDVVDGGSSLGFLHGLTRDEAIAWWNDLAPAVADGSLAVWAAADPSGRCLGTISLGFGTMPNGRHRAEVRKLMVHSAARGQGLGRTLLAAAERTAAERGITLLVLDTETGSPAERFYRAAHWQQAGTIPDYAADPAGVLRPTTLFYKHLARQAAPVAS
ncbi:GNAT family N-acetyltransferase [Streptomyces sp. VRA16 Mangrove soil]|uniref:GNAT family N-acetyltransferase n=1 Tax=Streptomyces sp. VRA16 Mangrove soil TaxID=2817434 RepID=UPI001A9DBEDD|nr:GNAT family N-acetyltransferase [Streptomyces sp. VRA16 Mangrove soil]MBO1329747.1 GNAT family N-acetyltransferase [Streptomyces sp. VRA16 Mangrove soil]